MQIRFSGRFHETKYSLRSLSVWKQFKDSTGAKQQDVTGTLILTNRWNEKDTVSNFTDGNGKKLFKVTPSEKDPTFQPVQLDLTYDLWAIMVF